MTVSDQTGKLKVVIARRRILVIAGDTVRDSLVETLSNDGFEADALADLEHLHDSLLSFKPDLVLIEENLPTRAGRQVALSMRANGGTFAIPIVGLLNDINPQNVLAWLRVGATDFWRLPLSRSPADRARSVIDECDRTRISIGTTKARLMAWATRVKLDGTVLSHPGTPFEGRATFTEGELSSAQFGPLKGERALSHFIEMEDGNVVWEQSVTTNAFMGRAQAVGFRARVLVVEDDPALRKLVMRQLEAAQYVVEGAEDGRQGLQLAAHKPWDVVVADLDLPKLDGWGMLRELRADVSMREISTLVLSAHEGMVDTLKASRAGARAYLKKSGRAKELIDTIGLLATPRATVWEGLRSQRETPVEMRAVGPLWFLRTLAELDCSGRLELEDELGRYELTLSQGQLIDSTAQTGSLRIQGTVALEAIISSRGSGRFVFVPKVPPEKARWVFDVVDETVEALRIQERKRMRDAIAQPNRLLLNEELAALFARLATVAELKVLEAVKQSSDDLESLAKSVDLPVSDVEPALAELLRRGVLVTPEPG